MVFHIIFHRRYCAGTVFLPFTHRIDYVRVDNSSEEHNIYFSFSHIYLPFMMMFMSFNPKFIKSFSQFDVYAIFLLLFFEFVRSFNFKVHIFCHIKRRAVQILIKSIKIIHYGAINEASRHEVNIWSIHFNLSFLEGKKMCAWLMLKIHDGRQRSVHSNFSI